MDEVKQFGIDPLKSMLSATLHVSLKGYIQTPLGQQSHCLHKFSLR